MESKPLVSLAQMKQFLDVREEITKLDSRYEKLIVAATRQIEKATGRWLTKQPFVEFFTSRDNTTQDYNFGGDSLYGSSLMPYAVDSAMRTKVNPQTLYLTGVNIDPEAPFSLWYNPYPGVEYDNSNRLTPDVDYQIDYDEDQVIVYYPTRYRLRAFKVAYTAGYAGDDILDAPEELQLAALTQAQYLNVKLRSENIGMATERTTNKRDTVHAAPFVSVAGLAPEVASMVNYLRRVRTGRG